MELFTVYAQVRVRQFGVELLAVVEVFRARESSSRIFLGDDFQICFRMHYAWYDSGYMFESVYGGGLLFMVFLRRFVAGSHLFVAGLPEQHRSADRQICFRMQCAWYDSGYMFESVYGGVLVVMVFLQPLVSDSHLFVAGLPEEYRYADILGDDFQISFRMQFTRYDSGYMFMSVNSGVLKYLHVFLCEGGPRNLRSFSRISRMPGLTVDSQSCVSQRQG